METGEGRDGRLRVRYLDDVDPEVVVALGRTASEVVPRYGGHTRGRGSGPVTAAAAAAAFHAVAS